MKTPEQIAEQMLYPRDEKMTAYSLASSVGTLRGLPPGHARHIRAALIAAIEADREQRKLTADGTERFYGKDLGDGLHVLPFGLGTNGIVDEEQGGIIAYCHAYNTPMIVRALRGAVA